MVGAATEKPLEPKQVDGRKLQFSDGHKVLWVLKNSILLPHPIPLNWGGCSAPDFVFLEENFLTGGRFSNWQLDPCHDVVGQ